MRQMALLRRAHLDVAEAYERLFLQPDPSQALGSAERAVILLGAYAVFGSEADVRAQGERALAAGASPAAILEAVLTATISRGPRAFKTALAFLAELPSAEGKSPVSEMDADPLAYFAAQFGTLPAWVRQLQAHSPDALSSYAALRSQILADGAVDRKTKELLTMLLNAVTGNESGIRSHGKAALRFGATREEVLDVLVAGIGVGGIVVWINGVNALAEELA